MPRWRSLTSIRMLRRTLELAFVDVSCVVVCFVSRSLTPLSSAQSDVQLRYFTVRLFVRSGCSTTFPATARLHGQAFSTPRGPMISSVRFSTALSLLNSPARSFTLMADEEAKPEETATRLAVNVGAMMKSVASAAAATAEVPKETGGVKPEGGGVGEPMQGSSTESETIVVHTDSSIE